MFPFFMMNCSFIYSLFLVFYFGNFGFTMMSIVGLKFFDIAFKIQLMEKIKSHGFEGMMEIFKVNFTINPLFRYANVVLYPALFYVSSL